MFRLQRIKLCRKTSHWFDSVKNNRIASFTSGPKHSTLFQNDL